MGGDFPAKSAVCAMPSVVVSFECLNNGYHATSMPLFFTKKGSSNGLPCQHGVNELKNSCPLVLSGRLQYETFQKHFWDYLCVEALVALASDLTCWPYT
jgi:hypothetical protein